MTPDDELFSMEVALMESVLRQVQYRVLPSTSNAMWKGLDRSDTTFVESVTADVAE